MSIAEDLAPTGVLRVSINLGNPVLAQGTAENPRGVTVDLARDLAARLALPVRFLCFDAARDSFTAVRTAQPTSASSRSSRPGRPTSPSPRRTR